MLRVQRHLRHWMHHFLLVLPEAVSPVDLFVNGLFFSLLVVKSKQE